MVDIEQLKKEIAVVIPRAKHGHGLDHADRVTKVALRFAEKEDADKEIVMLASMLHDVDDYKIFGEENEKKLINAKTILTNLKVSPDVVEKVLSIIRTMGYSKSLNGIRPDTIEGKVVSDADMCDAIGAWGILRSHAYNLQQDVPFFDKSIAPDQDNKNTTEAYRTGKNQHAVQHFFDKLLKINQILMTSSGREEGAKRQKIMVDFLDELFREDEAEKWSRYLHGCCGE